MEMEGCTRYLRLHYAFIIKQALDISCCALLEPSFRKEELEKESTFCVIKLSASLYMPYIP